MGKHALWMASFKCLAKNLILDITNLYLKRSSV